jgi:hypothetical protein
VDFGSRERDWQELAADWREQAGGTGQVWRRVGGEGPAPMNRFTTSLASLSIVTGSFFSAPSAHADSVTECYGGDYRFVISLKTENHGCPGALATSWGKAHLVEFKHGVQADIYDGDFVMGANILVVGTTAFSLALILRSTGGFALTSPTTNPHTNNRLPRAVGRPGA